MPRRRSSTEPGRHGRLPLLTRDPITGGSLVVTRLESPDTGMVIEGHFDLGWIARLSTEQLEFVEVLLRNRGNVQRAAADLGIAYNTGRSRLDDIVSQLDDSWQPSDVERERERARMRVLDELDAGDITFDEALSRLRGL